MEDLRRVEIRERLRAIWLDPLSFDPTRRSARIGYLQWHVRTRGDVRPPEPNIRNFRNIECRDAVLDVA